MNKGLKKSETRENSNPKASQNKPADKKQKKTRAKLGWGHRNNSRMEVAVYIISTLVVIMGIVTAVLFSTNHRDAGLWFSCVACCLAIIGIFCWFQERLWKQDKQAKNEAVALKGNDPNNIWGAAIPKPTKNMSQPNINISTTNQNGGFTGINSGTVNFAHPKPRALDERLRSLIFGIDELGPQMLKALKETEQDSIGVNMDFPLSEEGLLKAMCAEEGASKYIILLPPEKGDSAIELKRTSEGFIRKLTTVRIVLKKALLPQ